jgi:hypothetical protein
MKQCHLKSISGIICLPKLQILDIEDNEVSDLLDIDMCTKLNKINLNKNNISDIDNLTFLASMSNLEYLDIRNNPICYNNEVNIESKLNEVSFILWNHKHNVLSQDIVSKFDEKIYNSPTKKKKNKMEKEIDKILKDDENNKNRMHEKTSKIQILANEKHETKEEISKDNNENIEEIIDNNINNEEKEKLKEKKKEKEKEKDKKESKKKEK